ncbi:MAG: hypothetical protein CMN76_04145 [Spirochaetaceae bacterium]|nr:hypothetical protein [Spirochaetaceae bacterium]
MIRTRILLLSLAVLAAYCKPPEPVKLRVNLAKGDTYRQTVTTEQRIVQQLPMPGDGGTRQVQKSTTSISYTIECLEADEEGTVVKLTYDRIKVEKEQSTESGGSESSGPSKESVYDSEKDKEPTDPEAIAYSVMIGNGFSVKLSPQAEVLDMIGVEEFLDRVYSGLDIPDTVEGRQVRKMLKEQFGAQTMKHMLARSYLPYPEKEVGEGDSWNKTFDLGGAGFPLKVDNTYTVEDLDSEEATLRTDGEISSIKGQTLKIMTMEFGYDIAGKQSGEQVVDLKRGIVVRSEITQKMDGEMSILAAPQMAQEMKIPLEMETKVTLETH